MAQSQAEQQAQAQIAGEPTRTKERQPQPATGTAADPTAQAQQNDEQGGLERKMETRHLTMISLGGVIGTGLFLSSGYTIHQAGPLGAIIAYAIGSVLVYFIMLSLGELSVAMPYAGSFHLYAKRFIGPGTAFTIAVLYWLNWAVALASEFTAAGLLMQRWFPHSPAWIWSAAFIVVVFLLNILSVRLYGESEFWFASIKVFAIIAFIIIGLLAMFGAIPIAGYSHAPMFENFYSDGWLPNGVLPIFSTLLTVVFAFSGTEVVGVAAGETKDPSKAIPKAVHTTVLRLAIFFIGSIAVMAALIPWRKSGVDTSPFVLVFQSIGMPFARRHHEFRGADGRAVRREFRPVRVLAHGVVARAGGYDSTQARQNELPRRARFRGDVQHGRLAAGAAVLRGGRFDRLPRAGRGFRPGHTGGVGVGFRLPLAIPPPMARAGTYGWRAQVPRAWLPVRADRRDCDVRRRAGSGDLRSVAALHAAVHDSVRGAVLHGLLRVRGVAYETAWRAGRCSERLAKRSAGRIATPS